MLIGNITLPLDPPIEPQQPKMFLNSITSADLSWTSLTDSFCVTSYTITLTNITEGNVSYIYNTTTNTTRITVSDLTQRAEDYFTLAWVETGGRVEEKGVAFNPVMFNSECK